jgi:hypothetical protein
MLACLSKVLTMFLTFGRGIFDLWLVVGSGLLVMWVSGGLVVSVLRFFGEKFRQPFRVSGEEALLGDKALCKQGKSQMSKWGPKMNII